MERNVVSLETAKKLKAAGFPQETVWLWRLLTPTGANKLVERIDQNYDNERYSSNRPEHIRFWEENEFYVAPTAQEIADRITRLGNHKYVSLTHHWQINLWDAVFQGQTGGCSGTGDTIAEALAALWLKLNGEAK